MICLLILVFFFLYQQIFPFPFPDYSGYAGDKLVLTGKVVQKSYQTDNSGCVSCVITLDCVATEDKTISESAKKVRVFTDREPAYGSIVQVRGKLRTFEEARNPGGFDGVRYYATQGLSFDLVCAVLLKESVSHDRLRESIWQLRCKLNEILTDFLSEEDAGIIATMLLGEKSGLDSSTKELFKRNGVVHILTVSGLHISILGMGLYQLLRKLRLPITPSAMFAMFVMLLYGILVGMTASSFRAMFMFAMHLLARVLGRTYDLLTALALAAVLLLFKEPLFFYHSGYLFSFASVFAIGALLPLFSAKKWLQPLTSCLCIYLVTLPIHLGSYYEYPYISFLLNLLVIPLMSVLLELSVCLLVSGVCIPVVGRLFAWPVSWILKLYRGLCHIGDSLSWQNEVLGHSQHWQIIVYVLILALLLVWWNRCREMTELGRNLLLACGLLFLTARFGGTFRITFLDVGQGDCIYVRSEGNRSYLFDGGSTTVSQVGKYRMIPYLKYLGADEIECVFLSHLDEDHICGVVELMENGRENGIRIHAIALPDIADTAKDEAYRELEACAERYGIALHYFHAGMTISEGELQIRCIHPHEGAAANDPNENSLCFLVSNRSVQLLLTGDVTGQGEEQMWQEAVRYLPKNEEQAEADCILIWKIAHHGSKYSTPLKHLQEYPPSFAVISAGAGNTYGHPHSETLNRLQEVGTVVYRTDRSGAVEITVDKGSLLISEYLK